MRRLFALLAWFLLLAASASAEVKSINMTIFGMD
jgi:hypothetical protein